MLKPAPIFKDHMVLQQGKVIKVFGTAKPREKIRVTLESSKSHAIANEDGLWCVSLRPLSAREGSTLLISGKEETIRVQDIAIGEVWFAGGQSNMELPLDDTENAEKVKKEYTGDRLRFYQVPKCPVKDADWEKQSAQSKWEIADSENVGVMSAAAFYFARRIADALGCVVGIVDSYLGGTSITCWMSREMMCSLKAGQKVLDEYTQLVGDKTKEQYDAEMAQYEADLKGWEERTNQYRVQKPDADWGEILRECGRYPWPLPYGWQSSFRPNGLYETMVCPVAPYTIRGFLFYQGEEDIQRYECYSDLMQLLVKQWRTDWGDFNLPFLFVQLAMFSEDGMPEDGVWAYQRQQQLIASKMIQNASMVCIADTGEYNNIHPADKKTPGERLAKLALEMVYRKKGIITPTADQMFKEDNKLFVSFADAKQGVVLRQAEERTFEIAGEDGVFVPAKVMLAEDGWLVAESEKVPDPYALRYAWYNYGKASLFTEDGLAVSPFWLEI